MNEQQIEVMDQHRWSINETGTMVMLGRPPGNDSPVVPPGIYSLKSSMTGWWLQKDRNEFHFPFKMYGINSEILEKTWRTWENVNSNLSILMNGLKGTGKTVTSQLLANQMSKKYGMPVIIIDGYSGLIKTLLDSLQQSAIFIFDEFEKTFPRGEDYADSDQQKLLTLMSGLGNTKHKHFFLLTSNERKLDPNMVDRPGRIRYIFDFEGMSKEQVTEIVDDLLLKERTAYRKELLNLAMRLDTRSIDSVKCLVEEVNIHDKEPSLLIKDLNLSVRPPRYYQVNVLDTKTMEPLPNRKYLVTGYSGRSLQQLMGEREWTSIDLKFFERIRSIDGPHFDVFTGYEGNKNCYVAAERKSFKQIPYYADIIKSDFGQDLIIKLLADYGDDLDTKLFRIRKSLPKALEEKLPSIFDSKEETESFIAKLIAAGDTAAGFRYEEDEDDSFEFILIELEMTDEEPKTKAYTI